MSTEIPEEIVTYLAARDRERGQRIDEALAALTPRERQLVKEAAVMGYVRGKLAPRDLQIPPDTAVLRDVVAACLAMPDLYPTIARGPEVIITDTEETPMDTTFGDTVKIIMAYPSERDLDACIVRGTDADWDRLTRALTNHRPAADTPWADTVEVLATRRGSARALRYIQTTIRRDALDELAGLLEKIHGGDA